MGAAVRMRWDVLPECQDLGDGGLLWRAPAKLNLDLRILRRRPDGYHELDSLVAKVTLYDELRLGPRDDGRIELSVVSPFDCGPVESNLVLLAARALQRRTGRAGAGIQLLKHIPPGAGLGGGSSDAAAALGALNVLWGLDLPDAALAEIGATLGSDVPLFLDGPAVRISGRGQRVEPLEVHPFLALLHLPDATCPTAQVYAAWDELHAAGHSGPGGEGARESAAGNHSFGGPGLAHPASTWRGRLVNDLLPAALRVCPALEEVRARLSAAAGAAVGLTGSGSGLFVLADDEEEAGALARRIPDDLARRTLLVRRNGW